MIDPDDLMDETPADERPVLTGEELEAEQQAEQRRKAENLRWLTEHCDWQPFGGEW